MTSPHPAPAPSPAQLPDEVLAVLSALWRWRCGRISGLDLMDIWDQAEATIREMLPEEEADR